MASLPVPGELYFQDFAFDVTDYSIEREGTVIASVRGLSNNEHGQAYIHVPLGTDIHPGDILVAGNLRFAVRAVETDTYNGKPSLLKALS